VDAELAGSLPQPDLAGQLAALPVGARLGEALPRSRLRSAGTVPKTQVSRQLAGST
jgi:hypothetical protein